MNAAKKKQVLTAIVALIVVAATFIAVIPASVVAEYPGGPTAIAQVTPSCFERGGSLIIFDGSMSYSDPEGSGSIVGYQWTFSDLETGSSDNAPITTRQVTESIVATLEVVDDLGRTDTAKVAIGECSYCSLRLYGSFGEGPGDHTVLDPETQLRPENPPYTDPVGPFNPQHPQAPKVDFVTFNPAIMQHDSGYSELNFGLCDGSEVQIPRRRSSSGCGTGRNGSKTTTTMAASLW